LPDRPARKASAGHLHTTKVAGCVAALVLLLSSETVAQSVSIRVSSIVDSTPVAGALVSLRDASGTVVGRALSTDAGEAAFRRVRPGRYTAVAERIGMRRAETETFLVDARTSVARDLAVSPSPIELDGLAVETSARCQAGPPRSAETGPLWTEARRALALSRFADDRSMYRYETLIYGRDVARDTRVIERENQSRRVGSMQTPFRSRPTEALAQQGYVVRAPGGDT
jgi:hypothetical protein